MLYFKYLFEIGWNRMKCFCAIFTTSTFVSMWDSVFFCVHYFTTLCIAAKQCKEGLQRVYKSNRNVGSTFRLVQFLTPLVYLTSKRGRAPIWGRRHIWHWNCGQMAWYALHKTFWHVDLFWEVIAGLSIGAYFDPPTFPLTPCHLADSTLITNASK